MTILASQTTGVSEQTAARMPTKSALKRTVQRTRHRVGKVPPLPRNLEDLVIPDEYKAYNDAEEQLSQKGQLSQEQLSKGAIVAGAIVVGAIVLGAIVLGAIALGAIVVGAMVVGATVEEQLSRSNYQGATVVDPLKGQERM